MLNRYTRDVADVADIPQKMDPNEPPPNVWGERAFIVKLQLSLVSDAPQPHMMAYDRKRSFQVFLHSEDNPTDCGTWAKVAVVKSCDLKSISISVSA